VSGTLLLCHKSKYSTTHWYIIAPPFSSRKLPEPGPNPSPIKDKKSPRKHSDIKERLHLLKQLRKENMITEKEYLNKRREILNQL
jgi:hypothetical protein